MGGCTTSATHWPRYSRSYTVERCRSKKLQSSAPKSSAQAFAYAFSHEGQRSCTASTTPSLGFGGASFGNAGHIATELLEPLPSPALLFGFWRELFAFRRTTRHSRCGVSQRSFRRRRRSAAAALRRRENTRYLAPIVRPAAVALEEMLREDRPPRLAPSERPLRSWLERRRRTTLLRRKRRRWKNWRCPPHPPQRICCQAARHAAQAQTRRRPLVPQMCSRARPARNRAGVRHGSRLSAALPFCAGTVRAVQPRGDTGSRYLQTWSPLSSRAAVVCAGAWTAPLLASVSGSNAPLEAARGYRVEMPPSAPARRCSAFCTRTRKVSGHADDLTASRLKLHGVPGSGCHAGSAQTCALARDAAQTPDIRATCPAGSWVSYRPVLPDYLPAIGRLASVPNLCTSLDISTSA